MTAEQLRKKKWINSADYLESAKMISNVFDPLMSEILIRHYLFSQTIGFIAETLFYSKRTIQRKHKKALDLISVKEGKFGLD